MQTGLDSPSRTTVKNSGKLQRLKLFSGKMDRLCCFVAKMHEADAAYSLLGFNFKKIGTTMLKRIPLLLILLASAMPLQAGWIKADAAPKPGESHYFDPETVQQSDSHRKVWMLSSYDEKQPGGHQSVKTLYQFDCIGNKARTVTILLYPDKAATTAVIGAHHDENREWFPFSPQSVFGQIAKSICAE